METFSFRGLKKTKYFPENEIEKSKASRMNFLAFSSGQDLDSPTHLLSRTLGCRGRRFWQSLRQPNVVRCATCCPPANPETVRFLEAPNE